MRSFAGSFFLPLFSAFPILSSAFYLPGVVPTSYDHDQKVPLHINRLTPALVEKDEQIHSMLSYDYYRPEFHFCVPDDGPQYVRESLGSIIFGDRILTSPFNLYMAKNETCKAVCNSVFFDPSSARELNKHISEGYNIDWLIDGLPAAQKKTDVITREEYYSPGFLLGSVTVDGTPMLHNHYDILVEYHKVSGIGLPEKYRVVGVLVTPYSLGDSKIGDDGQAECGFSGAPLVLSETTNTTVTWTYSVWWKESTTPWATRWDKYLHVFDPKVHWYSLIYSAIFVVLLVALVTTVLIRALKKDIARYSRLDMINLDDLNSPLGVEDGIQEDSGWKLVHGDVFRPPIHSLMLSVFIGNGAQLFVMTGATVIFALFGLLSPSNRGFLGTAILILYTFLGFIGGYVAARCYKAFGGDAWKKLIVLTPVLVPGIAFTVFFLLNFLVWIKSSSGAVPFLTMIVIVSIWFVISVPLSVSGSWLGFRQQTISSPTKTNQIPRQIPPAVGSLRPVPSVLITGLLPFVAIFVELFFIMTSIWTSKIYYMFGFLFLCYVLMIITSASATVLLVYFLLCAEDYRWQWRAFIGAGMTGGYVFLNAIIFWISRISFGGLTGAVLYLGYSALLSFLVFLLTGAIGFIASWAFVQKIYSSIKVD